MKLSKGDLRRLIKEAYVDYRDDSPLEPATARLLAEVFVKGFESHPDGGFLDPGDRAASVDELSYHMSKHPAVARKLYRVFDEMRMDSEQEAAARGTSDNVPNRLDQYRLDQKRLARNYRKK